MKPAAYLLWLLALLSGCSLLPDERTVAVYRLPNAVPIAGQEAAVDWSLRISRPYAGALLGSNRILVVPEGNRISAYEDVRWSAPVPLLWRDKLLDAFILDGRIRHLSSDSDSLQADLELGGTLCAFQSEYQSGAPVIVLCLDARLVDVRSRRILASQRFEEREYPQGDKVPAVVTAFGGASDRLASAVIDWTLSHAQSLPE